MSVQQRNSCWCRCLCSFFLLISIFLFAAGISITHLFALVFYDQLKQLLPLANGSMSYQGWEKVPTDLIFEIWVWNVTNPNEITKHGAKPQLKQVGPFAFRESRYKTDIKFFPNNTVAFREYQLFHFDRNKSVNAMENMNVTSVNMPYAVTAFQVRNTPTFIRKIASRQFHKRSGGLFVNRNVKEILLGYHDKLLLDVEPLVKRYAPHVEFQSKTGLFIGTNNTHKGLFLVHTGKGNLKKFNQIQRWNGKREIDIWPSEWANQIIGTDGSMFPPMVTKSSKLNLYTTDICRSLTMEYKSSSSIHGIPSLQFGPMSELMENATLRPKNAAFCIPRCLDSGVLNITKCQKNIPLAISTPHFTGAPSYAAAIDGMQPQSQYETKIDVEPNTGFVINAGRKMQMNIILQNDPYYYDLRNIPELLLLPLMWLNESGGIPPDAAALFKQHLLAPIQIVENSQWPLIGCGLAVALATIAAWFLCERQRSGADFEDEPVMQATLIELEKSKIQNSVIVNGDSETYAVDSKQRNSVFVDDELLRKLQRNSLRETDIL